LVEIYRVCGRIVDNSLEFDEMLVRAVDNHVENHVENQGITTNVGGELYSREFLLW